MQGSEILRSEVGNLLEVVDNLGLFVQLPDVHHPLGDLPAPSVDHLVPHHRPAGVQVLLFNANQGDASERM